MQANSAASQSSSHALADDLFAVFVHVFRSASRDFLENLGTVDLSLSQLKLLHVVADEREPTLKDIAEHVGLSLPAVSRAVDGLHRRGLIDRREDEDDRRMKRIRVTRDGREILERLDAARMAAIEDFTGTLTDRQRDRLAAALAPILAREDVVASLAARSRR